MDLLYMIVMLIIIFAFLAKIALEFKPEIKKIIEFFKKRGDDKNGETS